MAWAGSKTHANDHHRSIPLQALTPPFEAPETEWISLQKEVPAGDRPSPSCLLGPAVAVPETANSSKPTPQASPVRPTTIGTTAPSGRHEECVSLRTKRRSSPVVESHPAVVTTTSCVALVIGFDEASGAVRGAVLHAPVASAAATIREMRRVFNMATTRACE